MIRVFRTATGSLLEISGQLLRPAKSIDFDEIFQADQPLELLQRAAEKAQPVSAPGVLAPLQNQEVWAAGVTYFRSRTARIAESKDSGGGTFYDRVYEADRPELFFKSTAARVVGPEAPVRIRADSKWNVPEPELTLAINSRGRIFGYTLGNDMSSRDIEGENPLYLPQAKVYDGAAALGPALLVTDTLPGADAVIAIEILRKGAVGFTGTTTVGQIKRPLPSLAGWLYREMSFPVGCYLMTGTGIVPPDSFTLQSGDEIRIALEPVGVLVNRVA